MPTQKFWVRGLKHEDEDRLTQRVQAISGVFYAAANHQDQCAEVEFEDDEVTTGEIRAVIAELGYAVEEAG